MLKKFDDDVDARFAVRHQINTDVENCGDIKNLMINENLMMLIYNNDDVKYDNYMMNQSDVCFQILHDQIWHYHSNLMIMEDWTMHNVMILQALIMQDLIMMIIQDLIILMMMQNMKAIA